LTAVFGGAGSMLADGTSRKFVLATGAVGATKGTAENCGMFVRVSSGDGGWIGTAVLVTPTNLKSLAVFIAASINGLAVSSEVFAYVCASAMILFASAITGSF
jgi:hypothetical protein